MQKLEKVWENSKVLNASGKVFFPSSLFAFRLAAAAFSLSVRRKKKENPWASASNGGVSVQLLRRWLNLYMPAIPFLNYFSGSVQPGISQSFNSELNRGVAKWGWVISFWALAKGWIYKVGRHIYNFKYKVTSKVKLTVIRLSAV